MPSSPKIWSDGLADGKSETTTTKPAPRRRRRDKGTGADNGEARQRLLAAAKEEFARFGLMGARVDLIARRANANKQLIYYHFGDKEGLYAAVLEEAYRDIRIRERKLDLAAMDPASAMRKLIEFTFDYIVANPAFVSLLTDENVHQGVHIKHSRVLRELRSPFVELLAETLQRGEADGVFRKNVDPTQFYISLAGMCFFYFNNVHTLSVLFSKNLRAPASIRARRAHILDFVMASLRP